MDYAQILYERFLINTGTVFTAGLFVGVLVSLLLFHAYCRIERRNRLGRLPRGRAFEVQFK